MVVLLNAPAVRQNRSLTKSCKNRLKVGVKIGKTHPPPCARGFSVGINIIFSVVAHSSTLTPRSMYFCHNELSCPFPPANTPPVPHDNPSPPRLRTLSSPDHRPPPPNIKADCCISPPPSPIGRCIVIAHRRLLTPVVC